jgi:3,5-epimerase/4-reductase
VTKIVKYERVVNIPNSMTILHELLPASLAMAQAGLTGVYNFTNPGVISHNEVLDLYIKYIDPTYTYTNFSLEEQAKVIKADRSNNELDTTKLMADMPDGIVINDIKTAFELCFQRMQKNLTEMGWLPDNMPAEFVRPPKA